MRWDHQRDRCPIDLSVYARAFPSLQFFAPEAGILELVIANKGRLNAATEAMHRDLARVWRTIDADEAVRVVIVRGEGAEFFLRRRLRHDRAHDRG